MLSGSHSTYQKWAPAKSGLCLDQTGCTHRREDPGIIFYKSSDVIIINKMASSLIQLKIRREIFSWETTWNVGFPLGSTLGCLLICLNSLPRFSYPPSSVQIIFDSLLTVFFSKLVIFTFPSCHLSKSGNGPICSSRKWPTHLRLSSLATTFFLIGVKYPKY